MSKRHSASKISQIIEDQSIGIKLVVIVVDRSDPYSREIAGCFMLWIPWPLLCCLSILLVPYQSPGQEGETQRNPGSEGLLSFIQYIKSRYHYTKLSQALHNLVP